MPQAEDKLDMKMKEMRGQSDHFGAADERMNVQMKQENFLDRG